MNTTPPFPPELWEQTPLAVREYIRTLEARVTELEATVQRLLDRIGIPMLRLASRPGATRARWGKEGIWCGPLTGWIWWAECGRTALSQTTQPSEVMRPHDDSHSAGLERLQTDLCRALGRL